MSLIENGKNLKKNPFSWKLPVTFPQYYVSRSFVLFLLFFLLRYISKWIFSELQNWEINRSRLILLENVLGGGYFGLVKEGMLLKSSLSDLNSEITRVAVKTLKGKQENKRVNKEGIVLSTELNICTGFHVDFWDNKILLTTGCSHSLRTLLLPGSEYI